MIIVQGNYILATNAPTYTETRIYADLLTEGHLSSQIIEEIKKYDWNTDIAIAIAKCESGLNPKAFNPETSSKLKGITTYSSYGIFQLNRPYDERLYDYKYNISLAYELYQRRSWQPWTCWKHIY
jgi:hypothetical protein